MGKQKLIFACAGFVVFVAGCDCRGENMQEVLTVSTATVAPCLPNDATTACLDVCRVVFELDATADISECMPLPSDGSPGDYDLYTEYTLPAVCPKR